MIPTFAPLRQSVFYLDFTFFSFRYQGCRSQAQDQDGIDKREKRVARFALVGCALGLAGPHQRALELSYRLLFPKDLFSHIDIRYAQGERASLRAALLQLYLLVGMMMAKANC